MPRVLHVAATSLGSPQGTPAAVRALVDAIPGSLVSYDSIDRPCNLKSGPSIRRLLKDTRLGWALHSARRATRPDLIVAHHVEAAALSIFLGNAPVLFVAHTSLTSELESYFPERSARLVSRMGRSVDRTLGIAAERTAAVSPWLRGSLEELLGREVVYVPVPWTRALAHSEAEGYEARARFGLSQHAPVILYAGNLDRYQGWEQWLQACSVLASQHAELRVLVATSSPTKTFERACKRANLAHRVVIAPLRSEQDRRGAHAASTLAVVGRRHEGGIPVKLLEAFSRGVPAVVTERATSGLVVNSCASVVDDEDPAEMAAAMNSLIRDKNLRAERVRLAYGFLDREHTIARASEAFDRCVQGLSALATASARRGAVVRPANSATVTHA